jgi:carbonic anhydrase
MTINKTIEKQLAFKVDFVNTYDKFLFSSLAENGQRPEVLMVACCDSRIDPVKVMGAELGELFIIKNVANIVPPFESSQGYHGTSAALEFAVCNLKVKHIIILGHSKCGGIQSMFVESEESKPDTSNFINKWMNIAQPCKKIITKFHSHNSLEEQIELCAQYSLLNSRDNLLSFNFINEAIKTNDLIIHTWYFDLASGSIFTIAEASIV